MATVQELLRSHTQLQSDSARRDVEILLCHVLEKSRSWLYAWSEQDVESAQQRAFEALVQRRQSGEPIAYLVGEREFWSLTLAVNAHTLIPRPETELLVEWALELELPGTAVVLDLGTGSGAIALALASERRQWQVTGLDRSAQALQVAQANARRNNLSRVNFAQSDWYSAVADERFHLLLANPPYVAADDSHLCEGDVRFEPQSALVAAGGGYADLYDIIDRASDHLVPGGWLLVEHGFEQGELVRARFGEVGFCEVITKSDLADCERITGGRYDAE